MEPERERTGWTARIGRLAREPLPFSRRQFLGVLGIAGAIGAAAFYLNTRSGRRIRESLRLRVWLPTAFDGEAELRHARVAADAIRPLFPRKGEPARGDWLAHFDETGQTFNEYARSVTPAMRAPAGAILILPLGEFDDRLGALVARAAELAGLFYGRAVQLLPAEPLPPLAAGRRRGGDRDEQLLTDPLLEWLKRRVPPSAAGLLAMTPRDLTPGEGWNFVFGIASLVDRVGIWSLYRLADAGTPSPLQLRRVAGIALHELGHMFGIWHCSAYECCMNGANTIRETDAAPLAFCPECDAKVLWRFRLDAAPRYARLAEFARAHDLARDAGLWRKCAEAVGG